MFTIMDYNSIHKYEVLILHHFKSKKKDYDFKMNKSLNVMSHNFYLND